jgi:hypothetical protein
MPEHSRTPHRYRGGELVIVIDCADLDRSADFWTDVLGYLRDGSAGRIYQTLVPPTAEVARSSYSACPTRSWRRTAYTSTCVRRTWDPKLRGF